MRKLPTKERKITPQKAVEILRRNGIDVDEKKAKEILELMYFLSQHIVNQNVI
jgi:hypothetical protein